MDAVTPTTLNELAAQAQALAGEIRAVQARLRAAEDEPTRRCGFRLDDAAGYADYAATALTKTATDLARILGRSGCAADWGLCPDHGETLRSSGGHAWCTAPGCDMTWGYDRAGLPCTEPAAFAVALNAEEPSGLCAGHAAIAQRLLPAAEITPLAGRE